MWITGHPDPALDRKATGAIIGMIRDPTMDCVTIKMMRSTTVPHFLSFVLILVYSFTYRFNILSA